MASVKKRDLEFWVHFRSRLGMLVSRCRAFTGQYLSISRLITKLVVIILFSVRARYTSGLRMFTTHANACSPHSSRCGK